MVCASDPAFRKLKASSEIIKSENIFHVSSETVHKPPRSKKLPKSVRFFQSSCLLFQLWKMTWLSESSLFLDFAILLSKLCKTYPPRYCIPANSFSNKGAFIIYGRGWAGKIDHQSQSKPLTPKNRWLLPVLFWKSR